MESIQNIKDAVSQSIKKKNMKIRLEEKNQDKDFKNITDTRRLIRNRTTKF